jgi:hypothetical protein
MAFWARTTDTAPMRTRVANRSRGFAFSIEQELDRAGRLISVSLATFAEPYGLDGAREKGQGAAAGDIRRCYATPSNVFEAFPDDRHAARFWRAIKAGNFVAAQSIMQSHCPAFHNKEIKPFDGGAGHRSVQNNRGRVSKRQEPLFVVQTARNLTAYIKSEVAHVGEGKAGWAACAKILGGTRGLPQWITRHAGKISPGFVGKNYSGNVKIVRLENQVRYAQNLLTASSKATAVKTGIDRMTKSILIAERRTAAANPLT